MYCLSLDGFIITTPMSLKDIITTFGSVSLLESKGFRIVKLKN